MKRELASLLFAGKLRPLQLVGGLSNERELVAACPERFRFCSSWGNYVALILFHGIPDLSWFSTWTWKTDDVDERRKQLTHFFFLLTSGNLTADEKQEVGGWMLSEMLLDFPPNIWGTEHTT